MKSRLSIYLDQHGSLWMIPLVILAPGIGVILWIVILSLPLSLYRVLGLVGSSMALITVVAGVLLFIREREVRFFKKYLNLVSRGVSGETDVFEQALGLIERAESGGIISPNNAKALRKLASRVVPERERSV